MKDYYATLGVTPQAEDIVIKAAYRALAQRYHPDRYSGSPDEAHRKMAEINEAYGVLSDSEKRKAYDAEYQNAALDESDFDAGDAAADEGVKQLDRDWETALEYYPDLATIEASLAKTSKSLAFTFRLYMTSSKAFKKRHEISEEIHLAFLRNYFGEVPAILAFAKRLIAGGRKDAAKALNEAVRVLGDNLDATLVINKIKDRFGLFEPAPKPPSDPMAEAEAEAKRAELQRNHIFKRSMSFGATIDDVKAALKELGGDFMISGNAFAVIWEGKQLHFSTREACIAWFQRAVGPTVPTY